MRPKQAIKLKKDYSTVCWTAHLKAFNTPLNCVMCCTQEHCKHFKPLQPPLHPCPEISSQRDSKGRNYRKKSTVQNSIFVLLTLQCSSIKSISPENIESKLNNKNVLPRDNYFFFFFLVNTQLWQWNYIRCRTIMFKCKLGLFWERFDHWTISETTH